MTYLVRGLLALNAILLSSTVAAQEHYTPSVDGLGNYRWRYLDVNGDKREFTFVPASRIVPAVVVQLVATPEGGFRFLYAIRNAPTASQGLRSCVVDVALGTAIVASPLGWEPIQPQTVPRVSWYMRRTDRGIEGIPPGGNAAGFELSSPALPGVVEFRCRGNIPGPEYPEDLPEDIELQVVKLQTLDDVGVSTIGPSIPGPIDPLPVLIRRIVRNYRQPIVRSNGTHKAAIGKELDRIAAVDFEDDDAVRAVIQSAADLVSRPEDDEWARNLSRGLDIALKHILKRLPPPRLKGC